MGRPGTALVTGIAVVGAGVEGRWLAQCAARAGYSVVLEDLMPSRRRAAANQIGTHITYAASVEEAVREVDLVVDFVPDELESKLEIFSMLDRMAPPYTIFATPTRVLSIADLASCTYRADRCFGLRLPDLPLPEEANEDTAGYAVQVIHAPNVTQTALHAVVRFWETLGAQVTTSVDLAALP